MKFRIRSNKPNALVAPGGHDVGRSLQRFLRKRAIEGQSGFERRDPRRVPHKTIVAAGSRAEFPAPIPAAARPAGEEQPRAELPTAMAAHFEAAAQKMAEEHFPGAYSFRAAAKVPAGKHSAVEERSRAEGHCPPWTYSPGGRCRRLAWCWRATTS